MKTLNQMAKEFNTAYEIEPIGHTEFELKDVMRLIEDELGELYEEINVEDVEDIDIKGVAAEMTDILYITMERMTALGFDVDALLAEKHRSNMSKVIHSDFGESSLKLKFELEEALERYPAAEIVVVEGGFVLKCRDTKKVIKPMCYSKAIITDAMVGK